MDRDLISPDLPVVPDFIDDDELQPEPQPAPQQPVPQRQEINVNELLNHIRALTDNQNYLIESINRLKAKDEDPFLQFRTPDPIKNLANFSGNKKETQAWIQDTENTLKLFDAYKNKPMYAQIVRAVKNKITGEAKEVLIASGNPEKWTEIKEIILNAYGDKRDLTSHIQSLFYIKQGNKSLVEYYNRIKSIDTAIKASASTIDEYKESTRAINKLISLMTLTRFVDGLGEHISMHVRSYRPETLEEAYMITTQYSNAAYRQKLERKPALDRYASTDKKNYNSSSYKPAVPPLNQSKQQIPDKPSGSARFRNFKQAPDEDVSMRTARSRAEINNHEDRKPDARKDETEEEPGTSLLDSEDDEFLVDELNFQTAFEPDEQP